MRTIKNIVFVALWAFVFVAPWAFVFVACSHDSFQPGPEADTSRGNVWFSSDVRTDYFFYSQPSADDAVAVPLCRANADEALDVPVSAVADDGLSIPATVHFDAGQTTAELRITAPGIAQYKPLSFTLSIPEGYADPYAVKDGTTSVTASVLWSEWVNVADTVLVVSGYSNFPRQGCMLQNFKGANAFRFTDFLGSGKPLIFAIDCKLNSDDLTRNSGALLPLDCALYNSATSDRIWTWADQGTPVSWTPAGEGAFAIKYIEFGWGHYYYESSGGYDNIDLRVQTPDTITLQDQQYIYDRDYWERSVQMVYIYGVQKANNAWDYLDFMICYKID